MKIQVLRDADAVAQAAASYIASEATSAIAARGRFIWAVSGGRTPWAMLRLLAREPLQWKAVHILQVDERIAPMGDPDRNLTHIRETLLNEAPIPADQFHAMPVESPDLASAVAQYEQTLRQVAGSPAVLDVVHLGLGSDGHTASLVPGDPVLEVLDEDVAVTSLYQGRRRMTLTFPVLNRARRVVWVVTGREKAEALRRLRAKDSGIPAGRVRQDAALVLADQLAAEE